jgi:hypothetical protein
MFSLAGSSFEAAIKISNSCAAQYALTIMAASSVLHILNIQYCSMTVAHWLLVGFLFPTQSVQRSKEGIPESTYSSPTSRYSTQVYRM